MEELVENWWRIGGELEELVENWWRIGGELEELVEESIRRSSVEYSLQIQSKALALAHLEQWKSILVTVRVK